MISHKSIFLFLYFTASSLTYADAPNEKETELYIENMFSEYGRCDYLVEDMELSREIKKNSLFFFGDKVKYEIEYSEKRKYKKNRYYESVMNFNLPSVDVIEVEEHSIDENAKILRNTCKSKIVLVCKKPDKASGKFLNFCFTGSVTNWYGFKKGGEKLNESESPSFTLSIPLSAENSTAQKIKRALQHYWKLKGRTLVDESFDEELF